MPGRSVSLPFLVYSDLVEAIFWFEVDLRGCIRIFRVIETMGNDSRPQSPIPGRDRLARSEFDSAHECRRGVRIPYHAEVAFTASTGPAMGTIRNISAGGMFVCTKSQLCVGQKFEMNFQFRSGNHTMKLLAQVVRETSEGLGLKLV
jgi:hypothetical protein